MLFYECRGSSRYVYTVSNGSYFLDWHPTRIFKKRRLWCISRDDNAPTRDQIDIVQDLIIKWAQGNTHVWQITTTCAVRVDNKYQISENWHWWTTHTYFSVIRYESYFSVGSTYSFLRLQIFTSSWQYSHRNRKRSAWVWGGAFIEPLLLWCDDPI